MEVPRLDHALSSPSSPCEEIKNLSLEAIQLCDRDGEARRHRGRQKDAGGGVRSLGEGASRVRGRRLLEGEGASRVPGRRLLGEEGASLVFRERAPLKSSGEGYRGRGIRWVRGRGLHWGEGTVRVRGRMLRCGEGASRVRGPVLPILQQADLGSPGQGLTRHREG